MKMNNSDRALLTATALMVVFIVVTLFFIWWDKTIPDSLIYCVLGSGTAEFGICGWIYSIKKKSKSKPKPKSKKEG